MKGIFSLLSASALAVPAAASTGAGETLAVLATDDAHMGQLRYLNLLLDRSDQGLAGLHPCLERTPTAEEVEACVRAGDAAPAPRGIILVLRDAERNPDRPGLAQLDCIGSGTAASDPGRQSITIWPRAYGLRSVTPFAEDRRKVSSCLAAARAEAVPPSLAAYEGTYPHHAAPQPSFLAHPLVRQAVEEVVADADVRQRILAPDGPKTPIWIEQGRIHSWGCEAHLCGAHNWTISLRLDGSAPEVCYHRASSAGGGALWYREGRGEVREYQCPSEPAGD